MKNRLERLRENPFYVLGVRTHASRMEIEREGQKLLAMLELGLASARSYPTPVGPGERTADKVRLAMSELRDPDRRLLHEVWARLEPRPIAPPNDTDASASDADVAAPWEGALAAFGWRAGS